MHLRFDQRSRIGIRLGVERGQLHAKYDCRQEDGQTPSHSSPESILKVRNIAMSVLTKKQSKEIAHEWIHNPITGRHLH